MNSPIIFEEGDTECWNGSASVMRNYVGPKNDWLSMLARGLNQPENSYCSNAQQWLLTGSRCNLVRQSCVLRVLWQWDQRAFPGMVWCWQANTSILHKNYDTDFDY